MTVAVIGLGLVGGSLCRDLAALGVPVLGHDADEGVVRAALGERVLSARLGPELEGIAAADVVVLAVPVDVARALLPVVVREASGAALITDVGSTKRGVVAAAEECGAAARFVGAHPMAGDHRSGWGASRRGLFAGARTYLCPAQGATREAQEAAAALWRAVGSETEVIAALEHDRRMAWVSHLPQATSTALALALAAAGHSRDSLGPGGRDMTRLAESDASMWAPVALDNAVPLRQAVEALEGWLAAFREALERGDRSAVERFFTEGRAWIEP